MEVAPPYKLLTLPSLLTLHALDRFIKKQFLEFPKMPGSVYIKQNPAWHFKKTKKTRTNWPREVRELIIDSDSWSQGVKE